MEDGNSDSIPTKHLNCVLTVVTDNMKYSWGRRSVGLVVGLLGCVSDFLMWGGCFILAAIGV